MTTTVKPPTQSIFVSYSHDSAEHERAVLSLSQRLRADGFDTTIDQDEPSPPEGWPRWMDRHISDADFVLIVCTETYARRLRGEEAPGVGYGVRFETMLTFQHIYDAGSLNSRFIPVVLETSSRKHVPTLLRGVTFYDISIADGYQQLVNRLRSARSQQTLIPRSLRLTSDQPTKRDPANVSTVHKIAKRELDLVLLEAAAVLRRTISSPSDLEQLLVTRRVAIGPRPRKTQAEYERLERARTKNDNLDDVYKEFDFRNADEQHWVLRPRTVEDWESSRRDLRQVVVLADAGYGKTALLWQEVARLNRAQWVGDRCGDGKVPNTFAVFCRAADLARLAEQDATRSLGEILLLLLKRRHHLADDELPTLDRYVRTGNCVLCIDGFDEVPSSGKDHFTTLLSELLVQHEEVRLILTSRLAGYTVPTIRLSGAAERELLGLTDSQIIAAVGLIRFGGHLPKGGYDVDHGGHEGKTNTTTLH